MVKMKNKVFRQVIMGIMIAIGGGLYLIESFVLFPIPLPGVRWGFSNLVVLIAATNFSFYETLITSVGKSVVGGLMSGRFGSIGFLVGMLGSVCAGIGMSILHTFLKNLGYAGISLFGAFLNNLVQIFLISLILNNRLVFYYFPYMMLLGTISALSNAFIAANLERRFKKV